MALDVTAVIIIAAAIGYLGGRVVPTDSVSPPLWDEVEGQLGRRLAGRVDHELAAGVSVVAGAARIAAFVFDVPYWLIPSTALPVFCPRPKSAVNKSCSRPPPLWLSPVSTSALSRR
jgi:hypothetical protein